MTMIGRKNEIEEMLDGDIPYPENKAFFGVKGVGKSTLMETLFSMPNCKKFAKEYKALYVRDNIPENLNGEDLTELLLYIVTKGVDLIDDELIKDDITQQIIKISKRFDRKDHQLNYALNIIKEYGYSLIIILDEFHNMGRNKTVGFSQYNYLRSLQSYVYYWTISDSDFSDEYATEQFKTSFFVQNFNPKTIPQLSKDDMFQLLDDKAKRTGIKLTCSAKESIYEIIGGVPGFSSPAIKCIKEFGCYDESQFDKERFVNYLLEDRTCLSFLNSWSRSLTIDQKEILLSFSESEKRYEDEITTPLIEINELGDKCGLGLLSNGTDEKGNFWRINTELFRVFILSKSSQFFAADVVSPTKENEVVVQPAPTYHIQNNYFTVNNNFFNPDSAVKSLLLLKDIASKGQLYIPDQSREGLKNAPLSFRRLRPAAPG